MDPRPVTVLDGGLSTALAARGHTLDHPLWTARLLLDEPDEVAAAHLDFLRAGADVVITASYQLSRRGLAALGHDPADADRLLRQATVQARVAVTARRAESPTATPRVAASVGPFGAVLADGSEYTGRYPIGDAELTAFHAERLDVLVDSAPDLLAVETLPGAFEAAAIGEALRTLDRPHPPSIVTFTCADGGHTAAGDRIEDAATAALDVPGVVAIGVNCTAPTYVAELLGRIATVTDLALAAEPNSGQVWDATTKRWIGEPDDSFDVERWRALGARWIGGCCGVGPDGIAALSRRADRRT